MKIFYYWFKFRSWTQIFSTKCIFQLSVNMLVFTALERGRKKEREASMWERNIDQLPSWTRPDRGSSLRPGCVPWLGIDPMTFQSTGRCSNQLSLTSQGCPPLFLMSFICFGYCTWLFLKYMFYWIEKLPTHTTYYVGDHAWYYMTHTTSFSSPQSLLVNGTSDG